MWQAEHVQVALHKLYPSCDVKILGMTTRGDQILDRTLSKVGGKGLFVKELEAALADGRADLAVHSLKDVPDGTARRLRTLSTILEREDPRDAFVSPHFASLAELPRGEHCREPRVCAAKPCCACSFPHLDSSPVARQSRYPSGQTRSRRLRGDHPCGGRAEAARARESRIQGESVGGRKLAGGGPGRAGHRDPCAGRRRPRRVARAFASSRPPRAAVEAERMVSRSLGGSCEVPLAAYAHWQRRRAASARLRVHRRWHAGPARRRHVESPPMSRPRSIWAPRVSAANSKPRAQWTSFANSARRAVRAFRPPQRTGRLMASAHDSTPSPRPKPHVRPSTVVVTRPSGQSAALHVPARMKRVSSRSTFRSSTSRPRRRRRSAARGARRRFTRPLPLGYCAGGVRLAERRSITRSPR